MIAIGSSQGCEWPDECSYFPKESASRVYAFQVCPQIELTVLHILLDKLKTKAFFFFKYGELSYYNLINNRKNFGNLALIRECAIFW